MTALQMAIERIKTQVVKELDHLTASQRRKRIKEMCRQAERNADLAREKLKATNEQDESVWQRSIAEAEAPYWAALELFRNDCPDGEE